MKFVVVGCGNIGSAIIYGLVSGSSLLKAEDITAIDISLSSLEILRKFNSSVAISLANYESVKEADIVLLAVKPWSIEKVLNEMKSYLNYSKHILVSVVAGVSIADLNRLLKKSDTSNLPPVFRVIPNTAISVKAGMTLISSHSASSAQEKLILTLFNELGSAVLLDEKKLSAGLAITSCGIAYCFKYISATISAGVELGFYPKEAQELAVKTMLGAAVLLDVNKQSPEREIDKVTTPGGFTIKGLNRLEEKGFADAVIQAIKAGVSSDH